MATQTFILPAGGFILGIALGCRFIQHETSMHTRLGQIDKLASSWAGISGLWARSIFLLVMLTFFLTAFTLLFGDNGIQWILYAGVVLGVCMDFGAAIPAGNAFSFIVEFCGVLRFSISHSPWVAQKSLDKRVINPYICQVFFEKN